jgi:hypothetical protein
LYEPSGCRRAVLGKKPVRNVLRIRSGMGDWIVGEESWERWEVKERSCLRTSYIKKREEVRELR